MIYLADAAVDTADVFATFVTTVVTELFAAVDVSTTCFFRRFLCVFVASLVATFVVVDAFAAGVETAVFAVVTTSALPGVVTVGVADLAVLTTAAFASLAAVVACVAAGV